MFYETNAIEWDYSIAFGKLINIQKKEQQMDVYWEQIKSEKAVIYLKEK